MSKQILQNHPLMNELRNNKRLQWLLLIIVAMLFASGLKALNDNNDQMQDNIQTQMRLLDRLDSASKMELTEQQVAEKVAQTEKLLSSIPLSSSVSVAEAEALSRIESLFRNVERGRSSLIGTDKLDSNPDIILQVRVEYQGQLDQQYFSGFLEQVDGSDPTIRLVSFRYRPENRGAFAVVLDFIYRQQA